MEEKSYNAKKKIIIVVAIIIALLFLFGIIQTVRTHVYNSQLRNMATEEMSDGFSNVYADIVSISPEYFLYYGKKLSSGEKVTDSKVSYVICRCETIEGSQLWINFRASDYPGYEFGWTEENFCRREFNLLESLHITGRVKTPTDISDDLEGVIHDELILDAEGVSKR